MEVACGEHGDYVQKLVVAVNAGRCNTALSKALEATGQKLIANDIAKETMPMKSNGECLNLPNGPSKNPGLVPPTCTTSLLGKFLEYNFVVDSRARVQVVVIEMSRENC